MNRRDKSDLYVGSATTSPQNINSSFRKRKKKIGNFCKVLSGAIIQRGVQCYLVYKYTQFVQIGGATYASDL